MNRILALLPPATAAFLRVPATGPPLTRFQAEVPGREQTTTGTETVVKESRISTGGLDITVREETLLVLITPTKEAPEQGDPGVDETKEEITPSKSEQADSLSRKEDGTPLRDEPRGEPEERERDGGSRAVAPEDPEGREMSEVSAQKPDEPGPSGGPLQQNLAVKTIVQCHPHVPSPLATPSLGAAQPALMMYPGPGMQAWQAGVPGLQLITGSMPSLVPTTVYMQVQHPGARLFIQTLPMAAGRQAAAHGGTPGRPVGTPNWLGSLGTPHPRRVRPEPVIGTADGTRMVYKCAEPLALEWLKRPQPPRDILVRYLQEAAGPPRSLEDFDTVGGRVSSWIDVCGPDLIQVESTNMLLYRRRAVGSKSKTVSKPIQFPAGQGREPFLARLGE